MPVGFQAQTRQQLARSETGTAEVKPVPPVCLLLEASEGNGGDEAVTHRWDEICGLQKEHRQHPANPKELLFQTPLEMHNNKNDQF